MLDRVWGTPGVQEEVSRRLSEEDEEVPCNLGRTPGGPSRVLRRGPGGAETWPEGVQQEGVVLERPPPTDGVVNDVEKQIVSLRSGL